MFRSHKDTVRIPVKVEKEAQRKYYCDLCEDEEDKNYAWDFELDFEIHRRRAHKVQLLRLLREPENYMCSVCMRSHEDRPTLISHIKKYHLLSPDSSFVKREIFICDYCNNLFFNKLLLIAHIKYYHLNLTQTNRTTICPACNKNILVRSIWFHFLYHRIHTSTCPICIVTLENCDSVIEHVDTHRGYYSCNLCIFISQNENLFHNHMEKHKNTVNIEGKDVNKVYKFFVPRKRPASWNRKFNNLFRGITMATQLQICVLCRAICESEEQMVQHIYGDHSAVHKTEIKRHICSCGEEFFNKVLLKHHIFKMKDGHHVFSQTPPIPSTAARRYLDIEITQIKEENSETNGNNQDIPQKEESLEQMLIENPASRSDAARSGIDYSLLLSNMEKTASNSKEEEGYQDGNAYQTVYQICSEEEVAQVLANYGQGSGNEPVRLETSSAVDGQHQTIVYEMIEMPGESNEESGRVAMEEPMYMM